MRLPAVLLDTRFASDPLTRRLRRLLPSERREEAAAFIGLYYRENQLGEKACRARTREVLRELSAQGAYEHTADELAFGARVAWRNSSACIGRIFWKSLEVLDARHVSDPDEMAGHIFQQMRFARSGPRVKSTICIFPPMRRSTPATYVESAQLVQFAGYISEGRVVGDPQNVELTRVAESLGWTPPEPRSHFDVLPLLIRRSEGGRLIYDLPPDTYNIIEISHPEKPNISNLGLRWYDIPYVSDMILTIGGVDYPCAPFNGFYMATEIACRNLVDSFRYDRLADVGEALALDLRDPLWRDEALTELTRAVLYSYKLRGVEICDHHTAGAWYAAFAQAEHAAARIPSGDWAWIVPPHGAAATPPFHMVMKDTADVPNFYRSRSTDGERLGVSWATELTDSRIQRWRRARLHWRRWVRRRML